MFLVRFATASLDVVYHSAIGYRMVFVVLVVAADLLTINIALVEDFFDMLARNLVYSPTAL